MLGGLGTSDLAIILVILIVIFGASRLPELGKGVGEAIRNFKKSISELSEIDVTPKDEKKEENKKD